MKNKITLLIIMLCVSFWLFASENDPHKDTLFYFEFNIRSEANNPILMGGIIKKLDYSKLDLSDGENFVSSFYEQGYFVPSLLIYDQVLKEIIRINNDSTLCKYLGQGQKFMNLTIGNGRETKLILQSGENVFLRITELTGQFLHCKKENMQLPSISNEYPPNNIEEIVDIYIPINITNYTKPSKKYIKEIIKNKN
ncbi:hypothetical protein MY04_3213 [Flammeovirga sp. MY04]|uniref:hypothetical protein n=1 Tax=Flammeovirga sp. MY04 TaxID=1191459 RepID=UPI00130519A4|nr:hypothetical protein [Flammeovirga sp. MY04]ANQ50578.2 hypothetical protein MY04_3213 [Flammeovirga sp. MY04]